MPLPTTRFALSYVGTAGNQGPHFAACTDPKVRDLFRCGQFGQRSVRTHDVPHLQRRDFPDFLQAPLAPTNPSNSRKSTSDLLPDHKRTDNRVRGERRDMRRTISRVHFHLEVVVHPGIIEPSTPVTHVGRVPVHLGNSGLRRLLGG